MGRIRRGKGGRNIRGVFRAGIESDQRMRLDRVRS